MEFLQNLLDNTSTPVLYAFILGLMTAISPCPLATNITAIGYISKDIENRKHTFVNGLLYTLGRTISYTGLGIILYFGASKFHIAKFFQLYGERVLGPLLVIFGILLMNIIPFRSLGGGRFTEKISNAKWSKNGWSALLLGMLFALAFCPYSGVLYFGMLIPMSVSSPDGLLLPPVFAIATGLPVILIAWLLAYSLAGIGKFYNRMKAFEKWLRWVIAVLFVIAGFYYIYLFYIK